MLRLSPDELYALTPRQFDNAAKGYFESVKMERQDHWERSRLFTAALLNVHSKKTIRPRDLVKFDWDKKNIGKRKSFDLSGLEKLAQLSKKAP
jgi:hypothetical protein